MNIVVQDLKKRQKTMDIPLRLKVVQEMKNLQTEENHIRGETSKEGSVGASSARG
jgi:hypothetical protein